MKQERIIPEKGHYNVIVGGGIAGRAATLCVKENKTLGGLTLSEIEKIRIQ